MVGVSRTASYGGLGHVGSHHPGDSVVVSDSVFGIGQELFRARHDRSLR